MKNRVLVVDDNRVILALIAGLLRDAYAVTVATSGEEALAIAAQQTPAVVLLDIGMPGIDGFETCRRLKAMSEGIQVVMVSAKSSGEERVRAFELGADAYLVKPFDPHVLCSEVRMQLRLRDAMNQVTLKESRIEEYHTKLNELIQERNRQIVASQDLAAFAMAKLAESRDEETGAHLIRVRIYSQVLADQLRQDSAHRDEITDQFLIDLSRASPLHDIGKVGVSDRILLKPGRLAPEEFDLVKMHSVLGARILEEVVFQSQSSSFLSMAVAIARFHHERFDGTGYPIGLRGKDIPLCARIVALADVFDALTSNRPYKLANSLESAKDIILEESGSHFDPVIVAAFEARFAQFVEIRDRHGDGIPSAVVAAPIADCDSALSTLSEFLLPAMQEGV